jgi:membrane protein insertase Oxa1/YidC/SpoIIIJ
MPLNEFSWPEMIIILFNVLILIIPVMLVWLLFKTLRKTSRQIEQISLEMKKIQEEFKSLQEKIQGGTKT